MTREEILWTKPQRTPDSVTMNGALQAMDEFASQQCIAFANFIAQHNYKPHDIDTWDEGRKNTHEVYDDFIEFQRIEQQNK